MFPLRLIRIAMEAEALRLTHQVKRTVVRAALGYTALVLFLGAVAFAHVAAWYWLRDFMAGQYAGLIFAGADLLFALILAILAFRSSPGRVELEALAIRRRALDDAAGSLTVTALLIRLVDQLIRSRPGK
jgi:hypothetical protein